MLRLFVLLITHVLVFFCGMGIYHITSSAKRRTLEFRKRLLDTHELFLDLKADRLAPERPDHSSGRHRAHGARPITPLTVVQPAVPTPKRPSLATLGLADAVAQLATDRARRVQEHRQFVDIMAWAKRTAGVQVTRQRPRGRVNAHAA